MINTILIVLFAIVFFQDVSSRAVFWPIFLLLFGIACWQNYSDMLITNISMSLAFIAFLLISLTLYLSVKNKQVIHIWQGFFSLGDILFIIAITPLFSWFEFIYFFTFGTIAVLILYGLTYPFVKDKSVPYAGYLSIISISFLVFPTSFFQLFQTLSGN